MTSYRTHARIRQYLADWMADRALVHTDLHRAQVDRIYMADPIVRGYIVGWDNATRTPYAYRPRTGTFLVPFGTPEETTMAILHRITINQQACLPFTPTASTSVATP